MGRRQQGFTLVEGLLITLILCVVGFAGYYVMSSRDKKADDTQQAAQQDDTTQSKNSETNAVVKTKTFTNKDFGVTMDLPESWTTKDESLIENGAPFIFAVTVSDGSNEASIQTVNGKGGDCQVKPTDKLFAAGNGCPTIEYTKVTKTNDGGSLSRSSLSDLDGNIAYWLCYTPQNRTAPIANKPQMGFFLNCGVSDIFIKIPNNTNDKAYDNEFVKQLETYLKTLSYTPKF